MSQRLLHQYASLVFDCDGVLLNSNQVKTDAFYRAALPYGEKAARALVDFHRQYGGVSRYIKFEHFLKEIVPSNSSGPGLDTMLASYAEFVRDGLYSCEITRGLELLRARTTDARWFVASGGDQRELREVFSGRGLLEWFDGGVFGSPTSKDEILRREIASGRLSTPALLLGDSRYDHQAARLAGLDFVFVSEWSEFDQWAEYCEEHSIPVIARVEDLLVARGAEGE